MYREECWEGKLLTMDEEARMVRRGGEHRSQRVQTSRAYTPKQERENVNMPSHNRNLDTFIYLRVGTQNQKFDLVGNKSFPPHCSNILPDTISDGGKSHSIFG